MMALGSFVAKNVGLQSQILTGPQGSPSTGSIENPWSGTLREKTSPRGFSNVSWKGKEKVDDASRMPSLSVNHDDGDPSGLEQILDEIFGIQSIKTPGSRRMQAKDFE